MNRIGWILVHAMFLAPVIGAAESLDEAEKSAQKLQAQYEENVRVAARYPYREFERVAKSGDVATVKRLLDQGVPVDLPLPWPVESWEGIPPCERAIHLAASEDHREIVRLLLDHGADPGGQAGEGNYTPLHVTNDIEIAKLLVSRGADVNARDNDGSQPIHSATIPGYLENRREEAVEKSIILFQFLIQHGADPLAKDKRQTQPIHVAAGYSTVKAVSFFIDQGAKVDATIHDADGYSQNGWQPLHFAASREDTEECQEIAELLIRKGADVNSTTAEGETPLHLSKNAAMTKLLLDHGAKVNVMTSGNIKEQPIHHFAMEGDVESLKLLLDHRADIEASASDNEQKTPLDTAVFWGKTETVKFLLERGAKPTERTMKNARRFDTNPIEILHLLHRHGGVVSAEMFLRFAKDRKTLLPLLDQNAKDDLVAQSAEHIADAAEVGDLDLIRDLVSLGAKADQRWKNLLPIHHAVASGKEEVVQYFLSAGQPIDAKCTARDEDLTPPMVFTDLQPIHCSFGRPELIPFLIRKGAKIDAATGEDWQPIHFAAAFGETSMLKAVIQAGGDPTVKTLDGETPLQLAEKFGKMENAEFLKCPQ